MGNGQRDRRGPSMAACFLLRADDRCWSWQSGGVDSTPGNGSVWTTPGGRSRRTRGWVSLVLCIVVLGILGGSAVLGLAPEERTFAGAVAPVQLSMSLLVPLIGILLVADLRRLRSANEPVPVLPSLGTALLLAELLAALGVVIAALAVALVSTTAADPWHAVTLLVLGSLLAQVVAVLTGTGLGLLVPSRALAFGITLLPVALWLALGAAGPSRAIRDWILPYGTVRHLLVGTMTVVNWGQLLTVLALWGLGLNLLGARRNLRSVTHQPPSR
jgi:hypothetical protein